MSAIIEVENLSKRYRLGTVGSSTLKDDLSQFWNKFRSQSNYNELQADENDRTTEAKSNYVWSLRDINFSVEQGEVLGIIGKNGAGKSTLLKLLSRVTAPTTGNIRMRGRVASLLEVGTGFHPELTGRENIYLNGAILGMRKHEITSKFDEIVAFAGVERYIDTPVKRYSSGMYVRLAFAVAAHLEPEILIVDEVLAVGDAEFQEKCFGKIKQTSNEGRTIIYVSHNIQSMFQLCSSVMLLNKGRIESAGNVYDVCNLYLSKNAIEKYTWTKDSNLLKDFCIEKINILKANELNSLFIENEINVEIKFKSSDTKEKINLSVSLYDENDNYILSSPCYIRQNFTNGLHTFVLRIPENLLNTGRYYLTVLLVGNNFEILDIVENAILFNIQELGIQRNGYFGKWNGLVRPILEWKKIND